MKPGHELFIEGNIILCDFFLDLPAEVLIVFIYRIKVHNIYRPHQPFKEGACLSVLKL